MSFTSKQRRCLRCLYIDVPGKLPAKSCFRPNSILKLWLCIKPETFAYGNKKKSTEIQNQRVKKSPIYHVGWPQYLFMYTESWNLTGTHSMCCSNDKVDVSVRLIWRKILLYLCCRLLLYRSIMPCILYRWPHLCPTTYCLVYCIGDHICVPLHIALHIV